MNPNDILIARQHAQDLLREAEQAWLIEKAAAGQPKTLLYGPALAWLGERLIAWGWRLRARYGAIEMLPTSTAHRKL